MDKLRNNLIEIYEYSSIRRLKEALNSARESFRLSQLENDAVRCEVLYELIESKTIMDKKFSTNPTK